MSASVGSTAEGVATGAAASVTTASFTINAAVGGINSTLLVLATHDNTNSGAMTCQDSVNGSTGWVGPLVTQLSATSGQKTSLFYRLNCAAGSGVTCTVNYSPSEDARAAIVVEVRGTDGAAPVRIGNDQEATQGGGNPGTGTDAVTSTTLTPGGQPGILVGLSYNTFSVAVPTAGTGFSSDGAFWAFTGFSLPAALRAEHKAISSTSAVAATFTAGNGASAITDHQAFAAYFAEPTAASDVTISPTVTFDAVGRSNAAATVAISPTLTVGMAGKSNAAAAVAISPTITFDAVGKGLAAATVAITPALTVDMVGKSTAAATVAISPTLTVNLTPVTSASDLAIAPTLTVGMAGKGLAAATVAISPSIACGMVGIASGSRVYPIAVHSSGRYYINQLGDPTPILEQSLPTIGAHLDQDSVSSALATIKGQGYTAFWMMLLVFDNATYGTVNEPNDYYNNAPLSTPLKLDTFSTSSAYTQNAQLIVAKANALELQAMLFPLYVGYAGGDWETIVADVDNDNTVFLNYGVKVAQAFPYPNVIWMWAGDNSLASTTLTRYQNLIDGIQSVARTRLAGAEYAPPNSYSNAGVSLGTDPATSDQQIGTLYAAGPGTNGRVYIDALDKWNDSPTIPLHINEPPYYGNTWGSLNTRPITRRIRLWGLTSGGMADGAHFGSEDAVNSATPATVLATLVDAVALDQVYANTLLRSVAFWKMRPTGTGSGYAGRDLIVSSNPDDDIKVTSCMASDGTALIAYVAQAPATTTARSVDVDPRSMAADYRGRWWNPTSGAYTNIGGGGYTFDHTASSETFTTPGNNGTGEGDWVLVLDTLGSPADVTISPIITVGIGGASLAQATVAISPAVTVGITGVGAALAAFSISPALTVGMTSTASAASSLSMSPLLTVAMESQAGALGGLTAFWRPAWGLGSQMWRPPYYPPYA